MSSGRNVGPVAPPSAIAFLVHDLPAIKSEGHQLFQSSEYLSNYSNLHNPYSYEHSMNAASLVQTTLDSMYRSGGMQIKSPALSLLVLDIDETFMSRRWRLSSHSNLWLFSVLYAICKNWKCQEMLKIQIPSWMQNKSIKDDTPSLQCLANVFELVPTVNEFMYMGTKYSHSEWGWGKREKKQWWDLRWKDNFRPMLHFQGIHTSTSSRRAVTRSCTSSTGQHQIYSTILEWVNKRIIFFS